MISLIACVDSDNGIGLNGTIPWNLREDMKRFRKLTTGSTIVMGRLTWESIGSKPLPNRNNIVITSKPESIQLGIGCLSFEEAVQKAATFNKPIFAIGGSAVYKDALLYGASKVILTRIDKSYGCDTIFPMDTMKGFKWDIEEWNESNGITYRYETYFK